MKKHRTLAEAHEALRRLREPLDEDPRVQQAYDKAHAKKADAQPARQPREPVHAA